MKKIRIGNDIRITMTVLRNGRPEDLSSSILKLNLKNAVKTIAVEDFTVSGNVVEFVFLGKEQRQNGVYTITLYEFYDDGGQSVVDKCDAFRLVPCSCQTGGEDEPNITTESIEVSVDYEINRAGGGTDDYSLLSNKPRINGVELNGNKSSEDLNLQHAGDYATNTSLSQEVKRATQKENEILKSVGEKVDKVEGKQLSAEDFTTILKLKLESLSNYDDTELQESLNALQERLDTLIGTSASSAIDTFNEITAFLAGITDTQNLTKILSDMRNEIVSLIPDKLSQLRNDNHTVTDENYVHTDNNFTSALLNKLNGLSNYDDAELIELINTKEDKFIVVNHGIGDTSFAIVPNVLHLWGEVTSLDITFVEPSDTSIVNEYMIQFTSGGTATTLALPESILWKSTPKIESGKTYQISIINNLAVIGEWSNA